MILFLGGSKYEQPLKKKKKTFKEIGSLFLGTFFPEYRISMNKYKDLSWFLKQLYTVKTNSKYLQDHPTLKTLLT